VCYQEDSLVDAQAKRPKTEEEGSMSGNFDTKSCTSELGDSSIVLELKKCRDHMNDILIKMESQSSTKLEGMPTELSEQKEDSLSSKFGPLIPLSSRLQKAGLVVWQDVSVHLPSVKDCEALIAFYFEELCSYFRISQRLLFEKQWRLLIDGTGIHRTEAAIIFTALALADILVPSASPMRKHSSEDHHRWMTLLGDPVSSAFESAVDKSFAKIQLLAMRAIFHMYQGRLDHLWESVGMAIRKATIFGLFDERTTSWFGLSNLDKEYRRRLAWYLLVLDRSV
jgi:hypothetical protein